MSCWLRTDSQGWIIPRKTSRNQGDTWAAVGIIKGAELKLFDNCGHNHQIENAAEPNRVVLSALRGDSQ